MCKYGLLFEPRSSRGRGGRSRPPRTKGLRSRPHPGPGAVASGRAAWRRKLRLSIPRCDGGVLRPSAGPGRVFRPLSGLARQSAKAPSSARYFLFDRPLRGRKEASGFRLLQPAPGAKAPSARFRSHSSANAVHHTPDQPLAPRWSGRAAAFGRPRPPKPCSPTRATHDQLPPSGTTSTVRYSTSRQHPIKNLHHGSSSGSAAAGILHWITR